MFRFFGAFRDRIVGFTCHDHRMGRNGQGSLVPLAAKVRKRVDEIGLSCFLEGSSFDPVRSTVALTRSAEVNSASPSSLDT